MLCGIKLGQYSRFTFFGEELHEYEKGVFVICVIDDTSFECM